MLLGCIVCLKHFLKASLVLLSFTITVTIGLLSWGFLLEECDCLPLERSLALKRLDDEVKLEG